MANSGPVVIASDQSSIPVAAQPDVTAAISIAANATSSGACTSTGGAATYVFQLTGTWVGTVQVQMTRDGSTWSNIATIGVVTNLLTNALVSSGNITANGIYAVSIPGMVGFRLITTAYTSGTITGTAALTAAPHAASMSELNAVTWPINALPKTSGGNTIYTGSITNTVTQVKSGAGQIYGWSIHNPNAAIAYVQFFALATGSVTLGTTAPVLSLGVPANGAIQLQSTMGLAFATAINVAVTTTRAGSTAPSSSVDLNIFFT